MGRNFGVLVGLIALLAGCKRQAAEVPYEAIETRPQQIVETGGLNAFDGYAHAADEAEAASTLPLDARDTPGNRRIVLRDVGRYLDEVSTASKEHCSFRFEPAGAFEKRPHRYGWVLLSRALVWRVEGYVQSEDWQAAVDWASVGMAFGADLCGGSMSDATIGYGLIDGARAAIAPYVSTMPPEAVDALATGTANALGRMPDAGVTIHNESLDVLKSISDLQEAHRSGRIKEYAGKFHGKAATTVRGLQDLGPEDRSQFFKALLAEEKSLVEQLLVRAATPGARRGPIDQHLVGKEKEVFQQFAAQAEPWMSMRDSTIARTRLLFATAVIVGQVQKTGEAPGGLSSLGEENSIDPYTGFPFGYISFGRDFVVYSYGIDGKDDRGDSNAAQTEPDLLLEDAMR